MFDPRQRDAVRQRLLRRAREDGRICAAAVIGSAASGGEDRWSDIDLIFAVADGHAVEDVLREWSEFVHGDLAAVHHFDLHAAGATYRAFLLPSALEIDLAFTPHGSFHRRGGGGWQLLFGQEAVRPAQAPTDADARSPEHLAGLAWHHVLHAASSIRRGRPWQAEHWISALRDHTLTLACARLGLPTTYARGADQLPREVTTGVRDALVRSVEAAELTRALSAATGAFLDELRRSDPEAADALRPPLHLALDT